jgi:hypothetical protein
LHAVTLAAQPRAQVDHQLGDIEPVGPGAPTEAFDRNARGIDDIILEAARLQCETDSERILAAIVADDRAHASWQ